MTYIVVVHTRFPRPWVREFCDSTTVTVYIDSERRSMWPHLAELDVLLGELPVAYRVQTRCIWRWLEEPKRPLHVQAYARIYPRQPVKWHSMTKESTSPSFCLRI
jgi:hypothetical protein